MSVRQPVALLMLAFPLALAARVQGWPPLAIFALSGLAIVPLAAWIGTATEHLAAHTGPGIGSLLNATFGNAAELIIAFVALRAGLATVVKASITGSIIGNILFVLGAALLAGGWGRERQTFSRTAAGVGATQLTLAVIGLLIPAVFDYTLARGNPGRRGSLEEQLSLVVAGLLILSYVLGLLFSLRTHRQIYAARQGEPGHGPAATWTTRRSAGVLLAATAGVAVMSETLVQSLEAAVKVLGWSDIFVGVILVPIIGNAAEHLTAVGVARKNQADLALGIALGSSTQIALFVAPVLVFASLLFARPMDLLFNPFELVAVGLAVLIVNLIAQDGESTWYEGAQLLLAYAIIAAAFFFHD